MKTLFIVWLGGFYIFCAGYLVLLIWKLIRGAKRMLSGWGVDWLTLATTLICGIVLAQLSWPLMIGILICWQLANKF